MSGLDTSRPVVSIVMPVFNYAAHLQDAIDSLRAQTYQDWECLIVDDGSTDDTPTLLSGIADGEPRIRVLRQANAGPAIARNTALAAIRGEFVQFLDADDLLHPNKLADHVAAMEAQPDVALLYGPTAYFDDGKPEGLRLGFRGDDPDAPERVDGVGRPVVDVLLERNVITIEAPLVRKAVFDELGVFDRELRRITDWEFWLRCALAGKRFAYLSSDYPLAQIRVHQGSLSYDDVVMHEVEIEMRTKLKSSLDDRELVAINDRALAAARAAAGIDTGLRGDALGGLRLLLPAVLEGDRASRSMWSVALLLSPIPSVRAKLRERRYGWRALAEDG